MMADGNKSSREASSVKRKVLQAARRVVIMDTDDWDSTEIERGILSPLGCELVPLEFSSDLELIEAVADADALLVRYVDIGRRHIEAMQRCKVIARSGVGTDIVDVEAATECGIWVTNVPSYCEDVVADHAVALILASARRILQYDRSVKGGLWRWQAGRPLLGLSKSTFGLIGFGKIGRLVWRRMKGFGCRGLIFDPYVPPEVVAAESASPADLDLLLRTSDIIHIQASLTTETRHMIGDPELRRMKPTAIITNAARGPIIDESALILALREGRIAGAALDDLEEEPAKMRCWKPTNPLLQLPNVIVTPHAAWYSERTVDEVKRISASEVARVLSGQRPRFPVNEPKIR